MERTKRGVCLYCGEPVSHPAPGVEYVKTKRKNEIFFHSECFRKEKEANERDSYKRNPFDKNG